MDRICHDGNGRVRVGVRVRQDRMRTSPLGAVSVQSYIPQVSDVVYADEFRDWWDTLSETQQEDIAHGVDLLQAKGHGLGFPWTSAIKGADFALRELRVQSKGRPLRVFYAFDPARSAVLLIGGEKKGQPRFYERMIRLSERLWKEYLSSYSN